MGRRTVAYSSDDVSRALKGVRKAGVEIKTIRVEPDGSIVINGDNSSFSEKDIEHSAAGYL